MKIKITADSTCDLSPEQITQNGIKITPLFVNMGGKSYQDGIDIQPAEIFAHVAAGGELCSTAAVPVGVYEDLFRETLKEYDAVVHISLGSGFSTCYQNACIAAAEFPQVRVVDSRNLSTGHGHVVMEACKLAKTAEDLDAMKAELDELAGRVDTSFLLDRLDYMVKGGRCSMVTALGANLLRLKPCIEVRDNKMIVGKKYRGNYARCMAQYVNDRLEKLDDIIPERIFITHTPVTPEVLDAAKSAVASKNYFSEVVETYAGCTISCHCGEGCLGVLFIRKKK